MKVLLDTHILLWAASRPAKLSKSAKAIISDANNELFFSAASIWEIVIKRSLGRSDFHIEPDTFRRKLFDNGYEEISISGQHAVALQMLPLLHKDPFDRIIIAQALSEGLKLLTADAALAAYPGTILKV